MFWWRSMNCQPIFSEVRVAKYCNFKPLLYLLPRQLPPFETAEPIIVWCHSSKQTGKLIHTWMKSVTQRCSTQQVKMMPWIISDSPANHANLSTWMQPLIGKDSELMLSSQLFLNSPNPSTAYPEPVQSFKISKAKETRQAAGSDRIESSVNLQKWSDKPGWHPRFSCKQSEASKIKSKIKELKNRRMPDSTQIHAPWRHEHFAADDVMKRNDMIILTRLRRCNLPLETNSRCSWKKETS